MAKRQAGAPPGPGDFDPDALPASEDPAVAEPAAGTRPDSLRLIRAGRNLDRRAGRPLLGEWIRRTYQHLPVDPIGGAAWTLPPLP
jgi:hypothetical protein